MVILLMEEILHQLIGSYISQVVLVLYHCNKYYNMPLYTNYFQVVYIPGGAGFLSSTAVLILYHSEKILQ